MALINDLKAQSSDVLDDVKDGAACCGTKAKEDVPQATSCCAATKVDEA